MFSNDQGLFADRFLETRSDRQSMPTNTRTRPLAADFTSPCLRAPRGCNRIRSLSPVKFQDLRWPIPSSMTEISCLLRNSLRTLQLPSKALNFQSSCAEKALPQNPP